MAGGLTVEEASLDEHTKGQMDRQMDGQTDTGQMDRQTDGRTDGRTDRRTLDRRTLDGRTLDSQASLEAVLCISLFNTWSALQGIVSLKDEKDAGTLL